MPQKMNPDLAELLRGKSGRTVGAWVTLMYGREGPALAYNKDLQETQEPLYDAVETLEACLAWRAAWSTAWSSTPRGLRAAVDEGHLVATELADTWYPRRGVPRGPRPSPAPWCGGDRARVELAALSLDELRAVHPAFGPDVAGWLESARAVDRRESGRRPARSRVLASSTGSRPS